MPSTKDAPRSRRTIHDFLAAGILGLSRALLQLVTPRRQAAYLASLAKWVSMNYRDSGLVQRVAGPGEQVRVRNWKKEPDTVAWIEREAREGDVFYDIGANVGSYSLIAHAVAGGRIQVAAFEPNPPTYASLAANFSHNGVKGIALPVALGDCRGSLMLEGELSFAGLTSTTHEGHGIPVLCERLDDLIEERKLPSPTIMKIDVDGAEELVLAGACRTLASPGLRTILIEMEAEGEERVRITRLLSGLGWREEAGAPRLGGALMNIIFSRGERP